MDFGIAFHALANLPGGRGTEAIGGTSWTAPVTIDLGIGFFGADTAQDGIFGWEAHIHDEVGEAEAAGPAGADADAAGAVVGVEGVGGIGTAGVHGFEGIEEEGNAACTGRIIRSGNFS